MAHSCWRPALALVLVLLGTYAEATSSRHMDDFIEAVRRVEASVPGSGPLAVLRRLRGAAGLDDAFVRHFLGNAVSDVPQLDASLSGYLRAAVHHRVTEDAREEGVVLTPDGTTVALAPLLLGIEAGFLSGAAGRVRGLFQLTLARALGSSALLGPDGCWDSVASPRVFTLLDGQSTLTAARVNGGVDGVVLGTEVSAKDRRPLLLSGLLAEYYARRPESTGPDAAPRLVGRRRRENFRGLAAPPALARQVVKAAELRRRLTGRSKMAAEEKKQLVASANEGVKAFVRQYVGE
ncbi:N-acetylmuramoyl-L-alanine amidase [Liparis tanakae]|uniref:N-acetylmuramoyl-L-alanine amidase n=1 Tax=Liparis tanakae TaxID=230148 RepID=A0A4Z2GW76_9TELE|nr:N-acetylmuramoyl-L-alanine amidase [Liparis tanakae]